MPRKIGNPPSYPSWRKIILIRDDYKCQYRNCKRKGKYIHHIKSYKDYPDLRFEVSNGITLCDRHHKKRFVEKLEITDT